MTTRPSRNADRRVRRFAWLLFIWPLSCTDAGLEPNHKYMDNAVSIRGQYCGLKPDKGSFPIRVLLAIDSSNGMAISDPKNMLVDAIENLTQTFRTDNSVQFGILRWGQRSVAELKDDADQVVYFTKEQKILEAAFARMRMRPVDNPDRYLGGTDFKFALEAIEKYLSDANTQTANTTITPQYYVAFLTDGMPQTDGADPAATRDEILAKTANVVKVHDCRIDVVTVRANATVPPEFVDLLPRMSKAGNGRYLQLSDPSALSDKFKELLVSDVLLVEFELSTINTTSAPRSFFAFNAGLRVAEVDGKPGLHADSDGDGIVDENEKLAGTDPRKADTDEDGLDDLFESSNAGQFDPLARANPALVPSELDDSDHDGLIAYVENVLGTDPASPDSDQDGIPDGIEFRLGTNPLTDDVGTDFDNDGVSNAFEVLEHTSPALAEPAALREEGRYGIEHINGPYQIVDGRRCYEVGIKNIRIEETLEATDVYGIQRPAGYNHIELWRMEKSVPRVDNRNTPKTYRMVKGATSIIFRPSEGLRDPPALELTIREGSFES